MWATRIAWAGLAVAVVTTMLLSAVPAHAAAVAPSAAPPQQWTYSYQAWANRSISHTNGTHPFTYDVQAYYGVQDTITATNTSATTTEMQGVRTVMGTYSVLGCAPNCTSPLYYANYSIQGNATETQYLNLTSNATVYENGTAAHALGVTNASASGLQQVAERATYSYGNHSYTTDLNEWSMSHFAVSFAPALGIIPWNLSKNLTWNSTSAYTASGGWAGAYNSTWSWNGSSMSHSGNFSWTTNHTGNESVRGKYFGAFSWHNQTFDAIGLRFHGPFDFDNGLFMTAIGSDLFAGATANWTVWSHAAYGNLSPAVASVYATHAAPAPSSSSSSGTSTSGGGTGGTTSGGTGGTTSGGTSGGTSAGTPPTTSTPTGTQPPTQGAPSQGTLPTQNAPTVAQPTSAGGHSSALASMFLPIVGLLVLAGAGAAVVIARQRGRDQNPP